MDQPVVIGSLDLSLRGAGMVAVHLAWGGDWSRVAKHTYGEKLEKDASSALRIGRLMRVAAEVLAFVARHACTCVVIEQYAFSLGANRGSQEIAELGGVVKVGLTEKLGIIPEPFIATTGRKLIMGVYPQSNPKPVVRAALGMMGMPSAFTMDEADAFVGANLVLSEQGGFALVMPPPSEAFLRAMNKQKRREGEQEQRDLINRRPRKASR